MKLRLKEDDDGVWLQVEGKTKVASINLEINKRGPIVQGALREVLLMQKRDLDS